MNQSEGGVFPRFRTRAVPDPMRSQEEGRQCFMDVDWVDIHIAGDNKTVVSKKVTDEHRQRWPEAYKAFKAGQDEPVIGTPLKEWAQLSASQVAELNILNIRTVEDLATLSDTQIQNVGMGGRELVAKAKAYIEAAAGNAPLEKLAVENQQLKDEIDMLKEQIKELGAK